MTKKYATLIRRGAGVHDLTTTDLSTGFSHTLDLTKATREDRMSLAKALCDLHGIKARGYGKKGKKGKPKPKAEIAPFNPARYEAAHVSL